MSEPLPRDERLREAGRDIQWYEIDDMAISGRGWSSDLPHRYARLPNRALGRVTEAVWQLGQYSAGLHVDFETDAAAIHAKWTTHSRSAPHPHMTDLVVEGLDLYARHDDRWRWLSVGRGAQTAGLTPLVEALPPQCRRYRLYFPLYTGLATLRLGLPPDARLWTIAPDVDARSGLCFYGTSIVQGTSASRPGMAYPSILGRRLDRTVINLGFSGSGKMEPAMADLLGELDLADYVIDCLPNLSEPLVTQRFGPFLDRLRQHRPTTPIVAVGGIHYPAAYLLTGHGQRITSSKAAVHTAITQRIESGDQNLHTVSGDALLGDDGEATVDGTHPTDLGMTRLADAIEPVLRRVVG